MPFENERQQEARWARMERIVAEAEERRKADGLKRRHNEYLFLMKKLTDIEVAKAEIVWSMDRAGIPVGDIARRLDWSVQWTEFVR